MPGSDVFGLSNSLWGNLPLDMIFGYRDRNYGWGVYDDFSNYGVGGTILTASLGWYASEGNTYRTFELKGGSNSTQSIIPSNAVYTVPTGFPVLTPNGKNTLYAAGTKLWTPGQLVFTPAADNDQCQIQMAGSTAALNSCPFTAIPAQSGSLYFETRLKFSALATTFSTFFIGLAGAGSGITSRPCATGAFDTNTSLLGFGCLSTDTANQLGWVYNKASGTVADQATDTTLNLLTLLGTTADTTKGYLNIGDGCYFKLGFRYDGVAQTVTPYINGVPQDGNAAPNKILGTSKTGSSTAWPDDAMTLTAGLFQDLTTYQTVTVDWWAAAQVPTPGS